MANKKHKTRLIYLFIAAIAFLIIKPLSDKEILPLQETVQKPINTKPLTSKIIAPKLSAITKIPTKNLSYETYTVAPVYAGQHDFDTNICSTDAIRASYHPLLEETIERLNDQYQHHYYKVSEYLELNVYAVQMTKYFEKELIERIKFLHQEYIGLLGQSAKREISINLIISSERSDYLNDTSLFSSNLDTTIGVYFGGLNLAFVDYQQSDDKALKTAIHETVHALSAHIIGRTPRMFSEGIAEFYEDMIVKEGKVEIVFYKKQLTKEPYPLMQFFDSQQWSSLDVPHLYYSSWAWIAFMYGDNNRLQSLVSFMRKEQINPCSAFSVGESYNIFQEEYSNFEADFYHWQQNMNTH
jgi:hypothetical protein